MEDLVKKMEQKKKFDLEMEFFDGMSYCGKSTKEEIEKDLEQYDYSEPLRELNSQNYQKKEFKKDYGKGERTYKWRLRKYGKKEYAVAERVSSEEELERMIPFCQCLVCNGAFYEKMLACACCVGCLGAYDIHANMRVLNETEKYILKGGSPHQKTNIFRYIRIAKVLFPFGALLIFILYVIGSIIRTLLNF